jgi:hypothetical protein
MTDPLPATPATPASRGILKCETCGDVPHPDRACHEYLIRANTSSIKE